MLKAAVFVIICFCFSVSVASAKIPPDVITHYKAYNAALETRDFKKAEDEAFKAWRMAEDLMGDHKTTGDLAENYFVICIKNGCKFKKTRGAYERAIELSALYTDGAAEVRLKREVHYGQALLRNGKSSSFKKRYDDVISFAEENGMSGSTFAGELHTIRSQVAARAKNNEKTGIYADKALKVFKASNDEYVTYYPYAARLYSGYSKEADEALIPALMDYQEIMQNLEGDLPRDHPFMMRALGRWMTMRNRVNRENLTEEAEAAGMCECWPFDKARNESVKPVKRVPPIMPRKAYRSGFSIVEFDLDDAGKPENLRILESWPEKSFEKSSEVAVSQWRYNPRIDTETDADRKDIITTITYKLSDENGDLID